MSEILKSLLLPSQIVTILLFMGVILKLIGRFQKLSTASLLTGAVMYILFSTGVVASLLISPLEYRYPFVKSAEEYDDVDTVVLLAGYAADDPLMPLSSQANSASIYRVLESHRIFHEGRLKRIIVSGKKSSVSVIKALLVDLGVPHSAIIEDSGATHTSHSAISLKEYIGTRSFFLVTSAGHMPRSVGVFRKQGMTPIPAPTDFLLPKNFLNASLLPSPLHMGISDMAVREYGGILWYRLTGILDEF